MVKCDLFDMSLALAYEGDKPFVTWSFLTDLPAGTRVSLSCDRTYLDMRNDLCSWPGHGEVVEVLPSVRGDFNGAKGRIDINASDEKALKFFSETGPDFSTGIKTPVSDKVTLSFIVGGRQRLRAFGKNNAELSGQMVCSTGGVNIVTVKESIHVPMRNDLQPVEA